MTPEELKYYTALQPVIKKNMVELKAGDKYYCNHSKQIMRYLPHFGVCNDCIITLNNNCEMSIWLPLPIDPDNPERGLWGMIKDIVICERKGGNSFWRIAHIPQQNEVIFSYGFTLTRALLKSLAYQEGIKV